MKYIIDVLNQDYSYDEISHTLKLKFYDDNLSCEVILDAESYNEPDRECIENEVWSFVNFLENKLKVVDYESIFNTDCPYDKYTYQEAQSKFEAWVKQRDKIHIGDEVVDKAGYKGVVTYIQSEVCDVLWDDGSVTEDTDKKEFSKTGRHFDEVEEMLKKIKEK